ncbi:Abi-domain-containing protein, partial [Rhodotorula sp. JG-1b]
EANPPRDRNHPAVIRARLVAVSVASLASCASLPLLLARNDPFTYPTWRTAVPTALRLLGLGTRPSVKLILYPLGLTASLFAGSLYISWLASELPGQSGSRTWADWRAKFDGWRGLRTYILGPLTEEITFRSCIMAVSALGGWSPVKLVFLTPLWFGIAHVHHAWETYVAGGRTRQALMRGTLQSTFQFAYTTIFGWYAAFLFLRTGSIVPPFLAHVFCNIMGIPPLGWALQVWPEKKKC